MEKKEITNDDVIQEFSAIKETSKTGFIIVIVFLLLLLGVCGYLLLKKEPPKVNDIVCKEQQPNEEKIITIKSGHTLETIFGKIVIDTDGSAYYIDNEEIIISNEIYKLSDLSLKNIGEKKEYVNQTYISKEKNEADKYTINAYKLEITNISSSYFVEYNPTKYGIIFLSYDGLVNELSIVLNTKHEIEMTLNKNIQGVNDIVSVIQNISNGQSNAILIDKYGNKYDYGGSLNNN